jgi:Icc-related predicted phosphoesterase
MCRLGNKSSANGALMNTQSQGATVERKTLRLAVLADTHYTKTSLGILQPIFAQISEGADILALCGDLTENGSPEEARLFAKELSAVGKVPVVAVLGNHDYESGKPEVVKEILGKAGVHVLDGDACEIQGVGFAGVKGFAGGFGRHVLAPWGEDQVKAFVHESLAETLKLESALARLRTHTRYVLLHYAPISDTVQGEPLEIFPFLGCSRLEEPLNRFPVNAIFHGHAHHGYPEGRTKSGVPVYNVAYSLLARSFPERPPFHLEQIAVPVPVIHDDGLKGGEGPVSSP